MVNPPESLRWRARYATNIPAIDAHHQGLFKILKMIQEIASDGREDVEFGVILEHLERHTLGHFEVEEALMGRTGFQGLASHLQEHRQFAVELRHLKQRFDDGEAGTGEEVVSLLRRWLHDHILKQDMVFAEHVRVQLQP